MWKRSLEGVLRIRVLLEDLARAELETRTQAVRRLESAADRESAGALDSRNHAVRRLMDDRDRDAWLVDLADAEILDWKSRGLRAQAETQKPAAAVARDALLDRRRERRQVESLLAASERAEEQERLRREQRQADDWFQQHRGTADSGMAPTRKGQ
jgi:hypothetical protein